MVETAATYSAALAGWVALAALVLLQAVVSDVAAIRAKHTPGMPVAGGHDDFLFRAVRAHAACKASSTWCGAATAKG